MLKGRKVMQNNERWPTALTWTKFLRAQIFVGICDAQSVQQVVRHVLTSTVDRDDAVVVNFGRTTTAEQNHNVTYCIFA